MPCVIFSLLFFPFNSMDDLYMLPLDIHVFLLMSVLRTWLLLNINIFIPVSRTYFLFN